MKKILVAISIALLAISCGSTSSKISKEDYDSIKSYIIHQGSQEGVEIIDLSAKPITPDIYVFSDAEEGEKNFAVRYTAREYDNVKVETGYTIVYIEPSGNIGVRTYAIREGESKDKFPEALQKLYPDAFEE